MSIFCYQFTIQISLGMNLSRQLHFALFDLGQSVSMLLQQLVEHPQDLWVALLIFDLCQYAINLRQAILAKLVYVDDLL